jgi:hypothetical protein
MQNVAFVTEVKNGHVTKVEAKCGDGGIYISMRMKKFYPKE